MERKPATFAMAVVKSTADYLNHNVSGVTEKGISSPNGVKNVVAMDALVKTQWSKLKYLLVFKTGIASESEKLEMTHLARLKVVIFMH